MNNKQLTTIEEDFWAFYNHYHYFSKTMFIRELRMLLRRAYQAGKKTGYNDALGNIQEIGKEHVDFHARTISWRKLYQIIEKLRK